VPTNLKLKKKIKFKKPLVLSFFGSIKGCPFQAAE
jgi:hypothetical protein